MADATLVVLAAGIGRRFGGLKQLEPVGPSGETLMEYSIYDALRAGFGRVVIVVREETRDAFRDTVEARVAPHAPLAFALQNLDDLPDEYRAPPGRTRPWGTGQAVLACRDALAQSGGRFAVVNADDYYGADAFQAVTQAATPADIVSAGYPLRDTLPDTGTVSRALCTVDDDGWLQAIDEVLAIERAGEDGRYVLDDGTFCCVRGITPVSMNFWYCPSSVPALLETHFLSFLEEHGPSLDAEFLLPEAIGELMRNDCVRVRVVPVRDRWCGITHPNDHRRTSEHLAQLVEQGVYAKDLWH